MRWLTGASGLSLALTALLQIRARRERREVRHWRGIRGDSPMDLTGLEQFEPANYTPAGRASFLQFLAGSIITVILGLTVLYAMLG